MPTVLRVKGYRFFFFSLDSSEKPHIHVEKVGKYVKYWLLPVELAHNRGFRSHELTEIRKLVQENESLIEEKWHEYFRSQS
jgi:hypothetical protein